MTGFVIFGAAVGVGFATGLAVGVGALAANNVPPVTALASNERSRNRVNIIEVMAFSCGRTKNKRFLTGVRKRSETLSLLWRVIWRRSTFKVQDLRCLRSCVALSRFF